MSACLWGLLNTFCSSFLTENQLETDRAQRQQLDRVASGQVKTLEERVKFLEQEKSEALQVQKVTWVQHPVLGPVKK